MKVLKSKAVSVTTNLKRIMLMTTFLLSYAFPLFNSVTVAGQWAWQCIILADKARFSNYDYSGLFAINVMHSAMECTPSNCTTTLRL